MSDEMRLNLKLLFAYCCAASYSYYYHVCIINKATALMGGDWSLRQHNGQFVLMPMVSVDVGDLMDLRINCRYYIDRFPQVIPIANVNQSSRRHIFFPQQRQSRYDAAVSSINHSLISDVNILRNCLLAVLFCLMLNMSSTIFSEANAKVINFFWFYGFFLLSVNAAFDNGVRDEVGLGLCEMLQNTNISAPDLYDGYEPLKVLLTNITTHGKGLGFHLPYSTVDHYSVENATCDFVFGFLLKAASVLMLIFLLCRDRVFSARECVSYSVPYRLLCCMRNLMTGSQRQGLMVDFRRGAREKIMYFGDQLNSACGSVYAKCCYRNHGLFSNKGVYDYGALGSSHNNNKDIDESAAFDVG
jgi:hypothetical protein